MLREELSLTGTKYACGIGVCGACTVLVDGQPRRACITPVQAVAGRRITTIEGIPAAHPVKQAWLRAQVPQCGYCQPGMIMQTIGRLGQQPQATLADLLDGLRRHLCHCGTYPRIRQALADFLAGLGPEPVAAVPPFLSPKPRLGQGFGLMVVPARPGFTLIAVNERRSVAEPPVWLWLKPDNLLTLIISKAEMGQGVYTALPLLAVRELDHPWDLVRGGGSGRARLRRSGDGPSGHRRQYQHRPSAGGFPVLGGHRSGNAVSCGGANLGRPGRGLFCPGRLCYPFAFGAAGGLWGSLPAGRHPARSPVPSSPC
ncbi:MAG: (2Fe-2S)-binding protein [Desulfobacca sp.]|uniref:(2Fe-2S)-binding protein n=1 Tax=Desulfobacca sp. TaxID=2067990 RepID=UPI004048EADB